MSERIIRIFSLLTWTLLVAGLWGMWTLGAMKTPDGELLGETERGLVIILTSGCCGSTWLGGLLALFLVFWMVRR